MALKVIQESNYAGKVLRFPEFANLSCLPSLVATVFATRDNVLHWACSVVYDIGFVVVIMKSNTVIVTDRDSALMNAVKTVFPEVINLLCWFHIDKNVKAKYKTFVSQKNAWDYVMEAWESLVDSPSEQEFDDFLVKFEIASLPWPMFVDYVKQTWLIPQKQRFVKAWINKIVAEFEHVKYASIDSSRCGCIMKTTHGLPCACELARYVLGSIPLDTIHMFWRRLSFSDQDLFEPEVSITKEMEAISKRFKDLDVRGKVTLKSKLREIVYHNLNSMCAPPEKVKTKGMGEDSWSLVRNHLLKELAQWSDEYIHLLDDIDRYEELKRSLLVDGLSMVTMDKWMNITDMGYVIA
ncbi:hypothetical protein GmHk_01G000629 [Glycine max]|nr:hypothetical protein GmHk_01G000629 [Glycine max]